MEGKDLPFYLKIAILTAMLKRNSMEEREEGEDQSAEYYINEEMKNVSAVKPPI